MKQKKCAVFHNWKKREGWGYCIECSSFYYVRENNPLGTLRNVYKAAGGALVISTARTLQALLRASGSFGKNS